MKKSFLFCLIALFLFSCNKDHLNPKKIQLQSDNPYEILTQESIAEIISKNVQKDIPIDPKTKEPIPEENLLFKNAGIQLTPCQDLEVSVFRTEDVDGCCMYTVSVYHKNYEEGPKEIDIRIFIDGNFYGGGSGMVGISFPVKLCNGPRLVELYSGGVLCFSQILTCDDATCCAELDYTVNGYQDGDCCVFEFTVIDPTECWDGTMAFEFNSDLGPPSNITWKDDGVIIHICHPEQRIRFFVWDDGNYSNLCYDSSAYTSNDCKI